MGTGHSHISVSPVTLELRYPCVMGMGHLDVPRIPLPWDGVTSSLWDQGPSTPWGRNPPTSLGPPQDPDLSLRFEVSLYYGGRVCPVPPPPTAGPQGTPRKAPTPPLRFQGAPSEPLTVARGLFCGRWVGFACGGSLEQQGVPGIRAIRGISGGRHPPRFHCHRHLDGRTLPEGREGAGRELG